MRRYSFSFLLLTLSLLACSCRPNGRGQTDGGVSVAVSDSLRDAALVLPLPVVPTTLTAPEERAAYILGHFWDLMDFRDTLRSHDRAFMEQNLVNFISLFPHARLEDSREGIGRLLRQAATDSVVLRHVCDIAEHYLDDPNSPMRNEDYYILFLEEMLRQPGLPDLSRLRPSARLATARKNRPGTVAADFAYVTRGGGRHTLHATHAKRLLLIFYDPACSHCTEIFDVLRESHVLDRLISDRELGVLAVYTEGDRKLWDDTKDSMPREWTVAIDDSRIVERGLYSLPAMPVIYLLDNDKKVIMKDADLYTLDDILENRGGFIPNP